MKISGKRMICFLLPAMMLMASACGTKENVDLESEVIYGIEAEPEVRIDDTYSLEVIAEGAFRTDFMAEAGVTIEYDSKNRQYIIDDHGKKVVFLSDKELDVIDIRKYDIDTDGENEYVFTVCTGKGTGFYCTDLFVIKRGVDEPECTLKGEELCKEYRDSIKYDYDKVSKYLTIIDGAGEVVEAISLYDYLDEKNADFVDITVGHISEFTYDGGTFFFDMSIGIVTSETPAAQYDYYVNVSHPVTITWNYDMYLGGRDVKEVDTDHAHSFYETQIGEILYECNYDLNHDGTDDEIILFVPAYDDKDNFERGFGVACMQVYKGNGDGSYAKYPIVERYFGVPHTGNSQMFITSVNGYDYLVETSFWVGQGMTSYSYNVFSEDETYAHSYDSWLQMIANEDEGVPDYMFECLDVWLNESSILLYASDIDVEPKLMYSTTDHIYKPSDYLDLKR